MGVRGLSFFMRQHGGRASANPVNIRLLAQAAIKRTHLACAQSIINNNYYYLSSFCPPLCARLPGSGQARSTVCVDGNSLLYHLYEGTGLNWLLGGQYAAYACTCSRTIVHATSP
jgi:hypothetical protein